MKDSEAEGGRCGGRLRLVHLKPQIFSLLYSAELPMPLIKAGIAKRTHANYSEIIHSAPSARAK